jgi:transposase
VRPEPRGRGCQAPASRTCGIGGRTDRAREPDHRAFNAAGHSGGNPRHRDFVAHLETLVTAIGEPLPSHTKQALTREHERLCVSERQIKEIEATQAAAIQATLDKTASPTEAGRGASGIGQVALLLRLKALGQVGASVLSQEVFYRHFDNRREVASYFGLTPSPYNSGSMRTDQGIGKAGNPRARTLAIELAWLWIRHQPKSTLTHWFLQRVGDTTGRIRRIAIVAVARKLMIALWRYVTSGIVPQGAVLKPA